MANVGSLGKLDTLNTQNLNTTNTASSSQESGTSFAEILKSSIDEGNRLQKESEKALADVATGQIKDLHQAAIAIGRAENSMKLMLEVRNKAVSAYKEILRTQI